MMEQRLKLLKESWIEIQKLREQKSNAQKQVQKYQKIVRSLSQEIPKKLNEFNERMV